jgi:predicted ATPase
MHLQRIQVPNFRALKNIDITFEKERIPRIFPLASLNGGGKSTLLQLIFTLLTCSADPDKHEFLVNILKDFEVDYVSDNTLATIELVDEDNIITLEFYCPTTSYLVDKSLPEDQKNTLIKFGISPHSYYFNVIYSEIEVLTRDVSLKGINKESINEKIEAKRSKISRNEMEEQTFYHQEPSIESRKISRERELESEKLLDEIKILEEKVSEISDQIETIEEILASKQIHCYELQFASQSREAMIGILSLEEIQHICSFKIDDITEVNLLCRVSGNSKNIDVFHKTSSKVFLAAPESQVFLFFSRQDIDLLFGSRSSKGSGVSTIEKNQNKLTNFFLYNLSIIKILAEAFEKAKHNDWQQAIKTRGQYGNEYAKISKDLEYVFSGKTIEPLEDLSGIIIKIIEDGQERILHPEDLSHGELRRLSFYAWLRTKEIKDSIVLVDEIEIGLHPDWQYQIVKDLEEWAPSNQYILATHSYEICSALTPAHVKEIEPKLVKPETASAH